MKTYTQFIYEAASSAQQSFYNDVRSRAKSLGASDVEADLVASQAALETGWGKSLSGKNNYFGQKASGKEAGSTKKTWEVQNGRNVTTSAKFKDYDDINSSVKYRLNKWGYKTKGAKDIEDAARRLQLPVGAKIPGSKEKSHGLYATDPNYVSKVSSIAKRYGSGALGPGLASVSKPLPKEGKKSSLDTPSPTKVLAKLKGKSGELDKTTGKFSKRDWSETEGSRYKAFGGK